MATDEFFDVDSIVRISAPSIFIMAWAFIALMFEEIVNDTLVWGSAGVVVPMGYRLSVYLFFPILILVCLLLLSYPNRHIKRASTKALVITIVIALLWDWVYLAFLLPEGVAAQLSENHIQRGMSTYYISWADVSPLIITNMWIMVFIIATNRILIWLRRI